MQTKPVILALLASSSCAPVATPPTQAVLTIDTDTIVPTHGPSNRAVLFDRLRISVVRPNESEPCSGCVNEFDVVEEDFATMRVSIGVPVAPDTEGHRVKVQLLLSAHEGADGSIAPERVLETVIAIPAIPRFETRRFTALVRTDSLGAPDGTLDAPITPIPGVPAESRVGTWTGAARKTCTTQPDVDQVCIPGGAFWTGNPRAGAQQFGAPPVRLVVVSPVWMDRSEVTVAAHRASGQLAFPWSGNTGGAATEDYCTYTAAPGPHELLPVNCVGWKAAHLFCTDRSGDLPTEAQFEWAASALGRFDFVWGEDAPACGDAVHARGGFGAFTDAARTCMPAKAMDFVLPVGAAARDRLVLEKGTVVDLAGSLGEWTRDRWQRSSEPCWSGVGVLRDPTCATASKIDIPLDPKLDPYNVTRGGSWLNEGHSCQAAIRFRQQALAADAAVGFRCVRPGI